MSKNPHLSEKKRQMDHLENNILKKNINKPAILGNLFDRKLKILEDAINEIRR